MSEDIGGRIKELRLAYGMTINQLSELLDITPGFMGLIELGKRGTAISKYIKISEIFKVSLDYLLTGVDKQPPLVSEDFITHMLRGLNQCEIQTLTQFVKEMSIFTYSDGELALLSEAISFQMDLLNRLKQLYR